MSWASLGTTGWVSFTNVQGAGLTLRPGQSDVTSNEWMRKSELTAKYFVDASNSFLSPKTSVQWIAKRDITVVTPIYIGITATYNGIFDLIIEINVSAALPDSLTISFDWCTNTSADGNVTFSLPATFSGTTTATANCSSSGAFSGTYASGNVTTTTGSVVNDFHVKGATISFSTADTTKPYLISYPNVDNACAGASAVVDDCIANCS